MGAVEEVGCTCPWRDRAWPRHTHPCANYFSWFTIDHYSIDHWLISWFLDFFLAWRLGRGQGTRVLPTGSLQFCRSIVAAFRRSRDCSLHGSMVGQCVTKTHAPRACADVSIFQTVESITSFSPCSFLFFCPFCFIVEYCYLPPATCGGSVELNRKTHLEWRTET